SRPAPAAAVAIAVVPRLLARAQGCGARREWHGRSRACVRPRDGDCDRGRHVEARAGGSSAGAAVARATTARTEQGNMIAIRQRRGRYALDGVNFFVAAMQAGFGVFVTVYLVQNGWAAEAVGLALTLSTVASLASQLPAGALIDRLGDKRRAVQVGVAGVGVAALLLALSAARPGVYLAQALQGLASSLVAPGIAAISLAAVGHAGLCERIGRNARFASIGGGLTAGVMGLAGSYFQPVAIFWLTAVLALPTLLFVSL